MICVAAVPHDLQAPSRARALIRQSLTDSDLAQVCDTAELVVSELVANAVRHGAAPVEVSISRANRHVLIEVHDGRAAAEPVVRTPAAGEASGRGMHLVAELSSRWGWRPDDTGKTVWAEI